MSNNISISDRLEALRLRLYSIACIEGIDRFSGQEARKIAVDNFLEDMFISVEFTQSIIKKNLTQEDHDFIKHWATTQIAERLLDDSVSINLTDNNLTVKVLSVRVPTPKNK